jgi:hypothetical protein
MAVPSYTQSLDTMVSTAIDTYSRDPINALTDSGEKFLKQAAQSGRVFMVNDSENVRHPIMYGHGEDSSLYKPDITTGTPNLNNLSATAKEVLTHAVFTLQAGTRNINFPQSQPPGNVIDYVSSVVKANMMSILNEEEILFLTGNGDSDISSTALRRAAAVGDTDFSHGYPVSLGGLLYSSSERSNVLGSVGTGDTSDESFAAVKTNDVAKWDTHHATAGATDHSTMIADMQKAILNSSYSEIERPTHIYTTLDSFEEMLGLLRTSAALPDPVNTNMGATGTIPFAGISIDWSRYLKKEVFWDDLEAEFITSSYPILGVNWNSLRLNTVRAGGISGDSIGFIRQIGDMQAHPLLSNVFKRIEWKRQWSVDNGRRSFFTISGNVSV